MTNEEICAEIEGFAYSYLTKKEIAIILGFNIISGRAIANEDHAYGLAFLKGKLRRKAEFNGEIIKLSKQLSSPAMALEAKLAEQAAITDQKDEINW